ncbi:hypothetical protein BSKO_10847 [Bryopsis sp. KO-2023]|nr:hypothetical protein BSKO_10847 [Bryopsis sp. KO-2023]
MGDRGLPESVFQKMRGKTKPQRPKDSQQRPQVFNQNVSRIKYSAKNLSTRLGFKETLQGAGNDFSHPPLSNDYLSFSHHFDIISGVPVFIFESDFDLKPPQEADPSSDQELPYSLPISPASSRHGKTQSLEIKPKIEPLSPAVPKATFKSAAKVVALATRLRRPPSMPLGSPSSSSVDLRDRAFRGLKRSTSLPTSKQVDVLPAEALSRNFFTSEEYPSPILCSVFDPSGVKLATGHGNSVVKIWDATDGTLQEVLTDGHDSAVAACVFLSVTKLATCDIAGRLVTWDLNPNVSLRALPTMVSLNCSDSNMAAIIWYPEFSRNGEYLALRPLHEHCDLYHKLSEVLRGVDLMPVLPRNMSVCVNVWTIREVLQTKNRPIQYSYKAEGIWDHDLQIRSIEFQDHDDRVCLIACIQDEYKDYHGFNNVETAVLVWPCLSRPQTVVVLDGMLATSSPNLRLVATWNPKAKWGTARGACFLWDMQHYVNPIPSSKRLVFGRQGSTPDSFILRDAASDVIYWCGFANNEHLVASIGRESIKILVWDVNLASKLYVLETEIEASPHVCTIDQTGSWLTLFTLSTGQGLMWDLPGGIQLMNINVSHRNFDCMVWRSFFSPTGRRLATTCMSRVVVWNPSVLKRSDGTSFLLRKEPNRNAQMKQCRVSLDGSVVGVEIYLHEARLSLLDVWNVRLGTLVTLPHERFVGSAELFHGIVSFNLSQDGRRVITWGVDIRAIIWSVHGDGVSVVSRFDGPRQAVVMDCSFIGNCGGSTDAVATCLKDGTLLFWKQGQSTESIKAGEVASCQFDAIGSRLVLMMKDMRTVVVWDLNARRVVRSTKFSINLRQMNKPAISKGWPMPLSPDGRTAVVGLEKDTLRPLLCSPESTMEELRSKVELVANSTVFSRRGDIVVMADFTSNHQVEEDDPCIWVLDTAGKGRIRQLRGIGRAARWLAVSGDGRTIACVSDGSTLTVWSAYGCSRCIPDYHQIVNSPRLKAISGDQPEVDEAPFVTELLEEYGSVLLNYPDCYGLSFFMHAVLDKRLTWLQVMAEWAKTHKVSLGLHRLDNVFSSVPMNALQQAIDLRSPDVIDLLLELILDGQVASLETSRVLGESLLQLLDVYPSIFFRTISDSRMLRHLGEVMAPETAFRRTALLEDTSDVGHPPEDGVQGFWRRMQADKMVMNEGVQVKAHARFVPYPDLAQVGSRGMLRQLLMSGAPIQIFGTAPIRGVIQYKWNSFAKRILLENLSLYTALLFLFTLFSILRGFHGQHRLSDDNPFTVASSITLIFTSPLAIWKLARLLRQLTYYFSDEMYGGWRGARYWLFSGFRLFEITTLLLVAVVIPVMHFLALRNDINGGELADEEVHGIIAPVSILLWWHMLYYTLPFKHTGPLVLIILEIMKDMTFFLCLGATVLAGFTVAFFVLFNDTGPCKTNAMGESISDGQCQTALVSDAFGSLDRSFVTTFGMMLGEFETEWYYDASQSIVPVLLWVVYMMMMTIILLNLLIAIMGATFQKVIQTEEVHFLRVKARVIDDMETIISWKRHKMLQSQIGKFLHVLVPQNLAENSFRMANQLLTGMWQKGFSDMVAAGVESLERKISTMAEKQIALQTSQVAIKDNQRAIRDDMQAIQDQVKKLFRQISGNAQALEAASERERKLSTT